MDVSVDRFLFSNDLFRLNTESKCKAAQHCINSNNIKEFWLCFQAG